MPTIFVAKSADLAKWASDVGLGKNVFKVGWTEGDAEEAVRELAESAHAGVSDWALVKAEPVEAASEDEMLARLSRKEKMVDPALYPRLRGARGIYRVKQQNVENHTLVRKALAGEDDTKALRLKPADYAAYLIVNATR